LYIIIIIIIRVTTIISHTRTHTHTHTHSSGAPPTNLADGGLQDGVEASLRGVQVAGDPLLLELAVEELLLVGELDDVLEGERRVAVAPRLSQPERGDREGEYWMFLRFIVIVLGVYTLHLSFFCCCYL